MNVNEITINEDSKKRATIWLDSDYLGGARHAWEVSPIQEVK